MNYLPIQRWKTKITPIQKVKKIQCSIEGAGSRIHKGESFEAINMYLACGNK